MTGPTDDDPVPHDAWLREALRHAPDAETAPPPRVDHAVLRMGRAAVAPPRAERVTHAAPAASIGPGWAERLRAAWDWLARPAVAGAFASLMVATVVGVMWWSRPLDEALPPREAAAPEAAASATADATTAATTIAAAAPEPAKAAQPSTQLAVPRAPARADVAARKSAPVAVLAEPAPAAKAMTPAADAQRDRAAAKTAPAGAAAPAQNEAPVAEAATRLRGAAERRELGAVAVAPPAAVAPAAPAATSAVPPADAARAVGALSGLTARAAASTPIATPGLSNLRFEIRPRPQAWRWQRDDGELREIDDALQGWIGQADRSARAHWQAGAAASEGTVATLRFSRDGQIRAVLRIGPKGLRLDRSGKSESAELSAGQAAALLAALDALGP